MKRIPVNCGQLGATSSSHTYSHSCNKRPSRLMVFASSWLPYATRNNSNTFIASASSSSISGGSGSHSSSIFFSFHYLKSMQTEQLLGVGSKKKRKEIAGIDQDELVDPKLLADPDSYFCEFNGVHIHHKIYEAESISQNQTNDVSQQFNKLCLPMILLHGFGASVFSWNKVMKPLAEATCSKVLAFDRPAFGLTSRVSLSSGTGDAKPINAYSMAFSVLATLHFFDLLKAEKAILVGHSAGSLVAVNTYFEAPERVAALILIAPAIFAPLTTPKTVKENQSGQDNQMKEDKSSIRRNPIVELYNSLSKIIKNIVKIITEMMKPMINILNSLYRKLLSAILRSSPAIMLVRMAIDKFGTAAVRNSWYDPKQVSEHVLSGYTKPLRVKDWDRALVEFTAAMLLDEESNTKPAVSKRLNEISCPGDVTDPI
ncbi:hypothetical protein TSUD_302980 [Trifolium subterraneum]|uniref:AB hydrolase-1 domain-containing protein n=1 Tax=Trifolium subterraneum TaxID=3900 RepID=A0A2Z6P2E0_TRISU|nr:hypothetical protein TSUD_302980 [Trifolium subterraneum]